MGEGQWVMHLKRKQTFAYGAFRKWLNFVPIDVRFRTQKAAEQVPKPIEFLLPTNFLHFQCSLHQSVQILMQCVFDINLDRFFPYFRLLFSELLLREGINTYLITLNPFSIHEDILIVKMTKS